MRLLLVIAMLMLVGASSGAQALPRIEIAPAVLEFGDIDVRQAKTKKVVIHNRGDQPLQFSTVRMGCGCTLVGWDSSELPPGASRPMEITLQPKGLRGSIEKRVFIFSNDVYRNPVPVLVRAVVSGGVQAEPSLLRFDGLIFGRGSAIQRVQLSAAVLSVVGSEHLQVEHVPQSSQVAVRVLPTAPRGVFQERVAVVTREGSINVPVIGKIDGVLKAIPEVIGVGFIDAGAATVSRQVQVLVRDAEQVAPDDVDIRPSLSGVVGKIASITPLAGGVQQVMLELRINPRQLPTGMFQEQVTVRFRNIAETLEIPLYGQHNNR